MKNILSYWDILLGFVVIYIGIFKLRKFEIYRKKRDNDKLRSGKWTVSKNDSLTHQLFLKLSPELNPRPPLSPSIFDNKP